MPKKEFEKILLGFTQAPASHEKVCNGNITKKQKKYARIKINVIDGGGSYRARVENRAMDVNEFQVDDC